MILIRRYIGSTVRLIFIFLLCATSYLYHAGLYGKRVILSESAAAAPILRMLPAYDNREFLFLMESDEFRRLVDRGRQVSESARIFAKYLASVRTPCSSFRLYLYLQEVTVLCRRHHLHCRTFRKRCRWLVSRPLHRQAPLLRPSTPSLSCSGDGSCRPLFSTHHFFPLVSYYVCFVC